MRRKEENLKFRLMVVEKLRLLKKTYSYNELAKRLGKPETVLCRYVKGDVLPGEETARELWEALSKLEGFSEILKSRLKLDEYGYADTTSLIYDPHLLMQASIEASMRFAGKRLTKVLTAAVNGVPLATSIALYLEIPLVVAKRTKDAGVKEFIEETYPTESPAMLSTLYIPKDALTPKDDVLIVDDLIRTGRTVQALINLTRKAKANPVGVFVLVAFGDEWRRQLARPPCPIEVALTLPPPKPIEQAQPTAPRAEGSA
ncbi:adenine phosphoribosyltransferase [Candidatus Geothermarchaeota archaeon ex4572_27]|nr:MAG: adenine phosphoribosyltransferase [Candidatus Geothermarchaeota archaeon ex4572_27]